jgi:hypothetical protein
MTNGNRVHLNLLTEAESVLQQLVPVSILPSAKLEPSTSQSSHTSNNQPHTSDTPTCNNAPQASEEVPANQNAATATEKNNIKREEAGDI